MSARYNWQRNIWTGNAILDVSSKERVVRCGDTGPYTAELWNTPPGEAPTRGPSRETVQAALRDLRLMREGASTLDGVRFAVLANPAAFAYNDAERCGVVLSTHRTADAARKALKRHQGRNRRANPETHLDLAVVRLTWRSSVDSRGRGEPVSVAP